MFVLLPRIFKSINKKIYRFSKRNSRQISSFVLASRILSIGLVLVIAPFGLKPYRQNQSTYSAKQTTVKLDINSPFILNEPSKTTNIQVGKSKIDLEKLGLSHDPIEIKVLIQETAPKYGVDWRLVYAIGYLESGNFNSSLARTQNNFFGRKASSGTYASWSSTVEAINNQCEYLKTRYIDRGMVTPYQMNRVYAEGNTWGAKVTSIMSSL